jgi:hypothetical protein
MRAAVEEAKEAVACRAVGGKEGVGGCEIGCFEEVGLLGEGLCRQDGVVGGKGKFVEDEVVERPDVRDEEGGWGVEEWVEWRSGGRFGGGLGF